MERAPNFKMKSNQKSDFEMIHFKQHVIFKVEKLCLTIYWIVISVKHLFKPDLCLASILICFFALQAVTKQTNKPHQYPATVIMKWQGTVLYMTDKYLLFFPLLQTNTLLKLKHLKISSKMGIFLSHFH